MVYAYFDPTKLPKSVCHHIIKCKRCQLVYCKMMTVKEITNYATGMWFLIIFSKDYCDQPLIRELAKNCWLSVSCSEEEKEYLTVLHDAFIDFGADENSIALVNIRAKINRFICTTMT